MIYRLSERFVERCCALGIIDSEKKDIYIFGSMGLIKSALNLLIPILLGFLLSRLIEMLIFLLLYCYLRRFAGGYHADSPVVCFIISQLMVVCVAGMLVFYSYIPAIITLVLTGLSYLSVLLLAPVEALNNPLNKNEKAHYRKKSILLASVYLVPFGITFALNSRLCSAFFSIFVMMAIHLIVGYIQIRNKPLAEN